MENDGPAHPPLQAVRASPARVHVELTTHCGLRCVFCSRTQKEDALHINPEVFALVRDQLLSQCCETELQGTGESLLFPGFDEILSQAKACGCLINLITNGLLLLRQRLSLLAAAGCQLVVSVDGGTRETYEWHRPGARFSRLVANLRQWADVREHGSDTVHAPSLTLHMTLTARNIHELESVLRLTAKVGANGLFVSVVRNAGRSDTIWQALCLDSQEAQVQDALLATEAMARELGVAFDTSTSLRSADNRPRVLCPAPWEHVYISATGEVYPCCQFQHSMGNCRDRPFQEIWQGRGFASLRQQMEGGGPPPECLDCVLPWSRPKRGDED